ncbi:MAG TPA: hypothetical protein VL424_05870 [Pararobbsia sp.]|nr:hypothetical protein [Pararobbsia sp.]
MEAMPGLSAPYVVTHARPEPATEIVSLSRRMQDATQRRTDATRVSDPGHKCRDAENAAAARCQRVLTGSEQGTSDDADTVHDADARKPDRDALADVLPGSVPGGLSPIRRDAGHAGGDAANADDRKTLTGLSNADGVLIAQGQPAELQGAQNASDVCADVREAGDQLARDTRDLATSDAPSGCVLMLDRTDTSGSPDLPGEHPARRETSLSTQPLPDPNDADFSFAFRFASWTGRPLASVQIRQSRSRSTTHIATDDPALYAALVASSDGLGGDVVMARERPHAASAEPIES